MPAEQEGIKVTGWAQTECDYVRKILMNLGIWGVYIGDQFPPSLSSVVHNNTGVVAEIEQTLQKHESTRLSKAVQWATSGKGDMAKLRLSLEAHKSAFEIALDMVAL
jgi:hypothetical protein